MNTRVHQLEKELKQSADISKRESLMSFFKTGNGEYGEGDEFLGIDMPTIRDIIKEYIDLPISQVTFFVRSKYHEFRMAGLLVLVSKFEKGDNKEKERIYNFFLDNTVYINNWDLVDVTIPKVVGSWLMDHDRKVLYKLIKSDDLWERRIAVLATYPLIRSGDFMDIIRIARALLKDSHDLIHKSVGWMLREVGKVDVKYLEQFLDSHATNMPRTMLRYSIERLPEDKRKYYMKK